MNGEHHVPDSVSVCQGITDRLAFKDCLCRELDLQCMTTTTTTTLRPTATTESNQGGNLDWSRSYSISAGLCILFLAMCAVIIVLRVFRQRDEPHTSRTNVTTVVAAPADTSPPPYEIVVQSPPSYSILEPPAYEDAYVNKRPEATTSADAPDVDRTVQGVSNLRRSSVHHASCEIPTIAEETSPSGERNPRRANSCSLVMDSDPVVDPCAPMHRFDSTNSKGGVGSSDA